MTNYFLNVPTDPLLKLRMFCFKRVRYSTRKGIRTFRVPLHVILYLVQFPSICTGRETCQDYHKRKSTSALTSLFPSKVHGNLFVHILLVHLIAIRLVSQIRIVQIYKT